MGLPLVPSIYGGDHLGIVAVMVSIIVPLYNVLAVISLEYSEVQKYAYGK